MTQPYLAFLLLLAFVAFNAALLIGLSHLVAPRKPTSIKDAPYESGMPPLGNAHDRFSVKFYLVAMLFIVFDFETVFLIPWGALYFGAGRGGGPGVGVLRAGRVAFLLILAGGRGFVLNPGALAWGLRH